MPLMTADVVVVGSGSQGCAVADRLGPQAGRLRHLGVVADRDQAFRDAKAAWQKKASSIRPRPVKPV